MYIIKSTDEIKEIINIYEDIIKQLCIFFIKIDIQDNPIKIYETFRYMYSNGFLSNDLVYSDIIPEEYIKLELKGLIPMDITGSILLTGYGVCRHSSDFLSHIYHSLGYNNSQLFTYKPHLKIIVNNNSNKFLDNVKAQEYIDKAINGLDLFSKEEIHFTKQYEKIAVIVDYLPNNGTSLQNHTMNIVMDKHDNLVHILDTRYHCVGERVDNNKVRLNYQGLTNINFVQRDCHFNTYYNTNYYKGLKLLKYDTNIQKDMLNSIIYSESCKVIINNYEDFWLANQEKYNAVTNDFQKLIKKISHISS